MKTAQAVSGTSLKRQLTTERRKLDRWLAAIQAPTLFAGGLDHEADRIAGELAQRSADLEEIRNALAENPAQKLFEEVFDFLRRPLFQRTRISDRDVPVADEEPESESESVDPWERPIAYDAWGEPWVTDKNGLNWSFEAVAHLQRLVFWESMEEMELTDNGPEKWNVLKWVFMPAIRKFYVWDRRNNRSHCFSEHERDQTFSFHNCCMSVGVDKEEIQAGFRRNVPVEIIQAVERICTF